jgi:hypothetical protein
VQCGTGVGSGWGKKSRVFDLKRKGVGTLRVVTTPAGDGVGRDGLRKFFFGLGTDATRTTPVSEDVSICPISLHISLFFFNFHLFFAYLKLKRKNRGVSLEKNKIKLKEGVKKLKPYKNTRNDTRSISKTSLKHKPIPKNAFKNHLLLALYPNKKQQKIEKSGARKISHSIRTFS